MPADDPNGRPPGGGFEGFRSYSDDTPREDGPPSPQAADEDLRLTAPAAERPGRRRAPWAPLLASGAVALALGAGVLLALRDPPPDAREAEAGAMLPVEVAEVAPPKVPPAASTPLDVLPDAEAQAPVDLVPTSPTSSPAQAAGPAADADAPELALAPVPRDAVATDPAPRIDPCGGASSQAEEMVCRDPELAAADRRMRQAYEAALDAGVPEAALALEQQDWRDIREMAAQRSRRAVASIYRQRIEELETLADEDWR